MDSKYESTTTANYTHAMTLADSVVFNNCKLVGILIVSDFL